MEHVEGAAFMMRQVERICNKTRVGQLSGIVCMSIANFFKRFGTRCEHMLGHGLARSFLNQHSRIFLNVYEHVFGAIFERTLQCLAYPLNKQL